MTEHENIAAQAALARYVLNEAAGSFTGESLDEALVVSLCGLPRDVVDHVAEQLVLAEVAATWTRGWQPSELLRQGRLGCHSASAARLIALAIAVDHAGRRSVNLHHEWVAQIESLTLPRVVPGAGLAGQWAAEERLDRTEAVIAFADVLANMRRLPGLDVLLPPPGTGEGAPITSQFFDRLSERGGHADPLLARIRNLLAKAESSTFEAEAMAFTAKAQELMTRHAIDAAFVTAGARGSHEQPSALRFPVDAPYVDAKSFLLHTVAKAGRCRAVFHPDWAFSTVVGFPSDLALVELLFTSLLVQAQTAMVDAARVAHDGTRARSKGFRSSFLTAYTARIGERLDEINAAVYAQVATEQSADFLPVLRSRSAAIDGFIADRFGTLSSKRRHRSFDAAGWASGIDAAERARLTSGDLTSA